MCKKHIIIVLALSFLLVSSAGAGTVSFDFENGNDHRFNLWSVVSAWVGLDDPNIAGDESLTGAGGAKGLPDAGMAWTVGSPNQFEGLKPAVEEGCHVVDGVLQYGPCNDPFSVAVGDPPYDFTNPRGQSGYLNTYNLSQWGDNLHIASNDQIATSPPVILDANAVLTVWSYGGGSGTHAPEYDPDPTALYTDGSSGIAVITPAPDYALLASVHTNGQKTLEEVTLDLSAFAGQTVHIEVVDAFAGSWGFLAVDEIQITNAEVPPLAGFIVQLTDGELAWGFDQAQYDHLTALGYDVDVISHLDLSDETFTIADANSYDVLVISESPNSNGCDSIIGTSAPMMHQEAFGWDNHFFMGRRTNPTIRWLASQTQVEVVNDTHPIMVDAGFSVGKLPWFTLPDMYSTEDVNMMAPGAELLVKADTEEAAVVFAFEKGAQLADPNRVAAGRVVCFSIAGNQDGPNFANGMIDASIMSDEQWALYDAALRWLDPPAVEVPPMVAHWPMDDDVNDVVGDNDGTILGNVSFVEGALGSAAAFAAEPNTAILVPDSPSIDFGDEDFSISMLLRYPVAPADTEEDILMKGTTGSPGIGSRYVLFTKGGNIRYEIDNGPVNIKSGQLNVPQTPVVTGEWVHLVVVRDSVNDLLSMYADGILIGTGADVSGDISSPGEAMRIGGSTMHDLVNQVSCYIDDVRIFPSALTEAEIAAIY